MRRCEKCAARCGCQGQQRRKKSKFGTEIAEEDRPPGHCPETTIAHRTDKLRLAEHNDDISDTVAVATQGAWPPKVIARPSAMASQHESDVIRDDTEAAVEIKRLKAKVTMLRRAVLSENEKARHRREALSASSMRTGRAVTRLTLADVKVASRKEILILIDYS